VSALPQEVISVTPYGVFNLTTRKRPNNDDGQIGYNDAFSNGVSTGKSYSYKDFRGIEIVDSDGHPWPRRRGDSNPDIGGPFQVLKSRFELICPPINAYYRYGSTLATANGWQYVGQVCPASLYQPGSVPLNNMPLTVKGTKGWARFKPTRPHAGLMTFIGELKDLPSLPHLLEFQSKLKFFRSLGRNYLNIEFGWKPFVRDLQKYFSSLANYQKILAQLARDNGRPVRRHGQIDVDNQVTETSSEGYFTVPSWPSYLYGPQPQKRVIRTTLTTRYWFSGQFRYYIPLGNTPQDIRKREILLRQFVFGAAGTPSDIYELIPWSWLIDWVSNLGDVISNVSDAFLDDGLVADYAYVMGNQHYEQSYIVDGTYLQRTNLNGFDKVDTRSFTTTLKLTQEVKARSKATPYGFGLDWSGFNLRQLAILASLGFTKLR
jgi:hypothetical protein